METTSPVSLEDVVAEDEDDPSTNHKSPAAAAEDNEQEEGEAAAGPPEKSSPHPAAVPAEDEEAGGGQDKDTTKGKGHKGAAAGTHNDKGDDKRDEPTAKQIENETEKKDQGGDVDDDGNGSGDDKGEHKCAKCKKQLPSDLNRFHCNECKDKSFDLCEDCYFTVEVQHVHAPLVLIKALDPPTILFSYQDSLTGHTVYLSNSTAALQRSKALRQKLGISAVLSLLEITPDHLINEIYRGQRGALSDGCVYHNIAIPDVTSPLYLTPEQQATLLPEASCFIDAGLTQGNTLVHCEKGRRRSPTLIVGWLCTRRKTVDEAVSIVSRGYGVQEEGSTEVEGIGSGGETWGEIFVKQRLEWIKWLRGWSGKAWRPIVETWKKNNTELIRGWAKLLLRSPGVECLEADKLPAVLRVKVTQPPPQTTASTTKTTTAPAVVELLDDEDEEEHMLRTAAASREDEDSEQESSGDETDESTSDTSTSDSDDSAEEEQVLPKKRRRVSSSSSSSEDDEQPNKTPSAQITETNIPPQPEPSGITKEDTNKAPSSPQHLSTTTTSTTTTTPTKTPPATEPKTTNPQSSPVNPTSPPHKKYRPTNSKP